MSRLKTYFPKDQTTQATISMIKSPAVEPENPWLVPLPHVPAIICVLFVIIYRPSIACKVAVVNEVNVT